MVKITRYYLTKNDCYKKGGTMTPVGIMWHSTGANNPYLKRYINPDDGKLGKNIYNNHWNRPGVQKMAHAFIGKLENGEVAIYQTLPWTMPGWHSGSGVKGYRNNANNNGYIGFEICEDDLRDAKYFEKVYELGIQLSVYLMETFPTIQIENVIGHYEGFQRGIASNHHDPQHWFRKFGKSMDDVRKEVLRRLNLNKDKEKVPADEQYKLDRQVNGYYTALDAKRAINPRTLVKPGTYFVYKKYDGMINVTRKKNTPGSWINPKESGVIHHTIVKGDTLWSLAKKYNTTVGNLRKLNNNIDPLKLTIGSKIRVK